MAPGELSSAVTSGKAPSSPGRPCWPEGQAPWANGDYSFPLLGGAQSPAPPVASWSSARCEAPASTWVLRGMPAHALDLSPCPAGQCPLTLPLNRSSRAPAAAQLPGPLAQPGPPQTPPTAAQAELGQPARAPSSCTCPGPQTVRQGHVQNPAQAWPLQATGEHFGNE